MSGQPIVRTFPDEPTDIVGYLVADPATRKVAVIDPEGRSRLVEVADRGCSDRTPASDAHRARFDGGMPFGKPGSGMRRIKKGAKPGNVKLATSLGGFPGLTRPTRCRQDAAGA